MTFDTLTIIGAGHMAGALVGGLCAKGFDPARLLVTGRGAERVEELRVKFGVGVSVDNVAAVERADLLILAVKPQDLGAVARQIAHAVARYRPLVLSVAAGVRVASICADLGGYPRIVRAMPNRPALCGMGITALFAPPAITGGERSAVEGVLRAVGEVLWIEREEWMDVVTAVSGSGPAYFFLLTELLEEAGQQLGLPAPIARRLAVETARGAGHMARETGADPARLRAEVASPGGTTAAALEVLENADLRGIVRRAVAAAQRRAADLANK